MPTRNMVQDSPSPILLLRSMDGAVTVPRPARSDRGETSESPWGHGKTPFLAALNRPDSSLGSRGASSPAGTAWFRSMGRPRARGERRSGWFLVCIRLRRPWRDAVVTVSRRRRSRRRARFDDAVRSRHDGEILKGSGKVDDVDHDVGKGRVAPRQWTGEVACRMPSRKTQTRFRSHSAPVRRKPRQGRVGLRKAPLEGPAARRRFGWRTCGWQAPPLQVRQERRAMRGVPALLRFSDLAQMAAPT